MMGALPAGWDFVLGIERDESFVEIARKRLEKLSCTPSKRGKG
jgi:protein-L-isoaspartate O-methyltransferase